MEVTSDRSADLIVTEGLAKRSWQPRKSLLVRERGSGNGEATEVSEARLDGSARRNTPRMNPSEPAEADQAS